MVNRIPNCDIYYRICVRRALNDASRECGVIVSPNQRIAVRQAIADITEDQEALSELFDDVEGNTGYVML